MLDFTSALYLGLRHPSGSLAPWNALTLGRPAALEEPPDADAIAGELAQLQGCEAATALPSTLHLFWDLFRVLASKRAAILYDAGIYPIARWGIERAAGTGVTVRKFRHHDAEALARLAGRAVSAGLQPVVVAEGYCPGCGEITPIRTYAEIARSSDGYLVVDDTQALGVLGDGTGAASPLGEGGGGSLRWHGVFGPHIVLGSSLAKGFGAPLAVLSGSRDLIERFRERSETRVHCSPPSVAALRGARRALLVNCHHGETLRRRLLELVAWLRQRLVEAGLTPVGSILFPVQSFRAEHPATIPVLVMRLLRMGVRTLLTRRCGAPTATLTLLVTARHRFADIDALGQVVADAARDARRELVRLAGTARTEFPLSNLSRPRDLARPPGAW